MSCHFRLIATILISVVFFPSFECLASSSREDLQRIYERNQIYDRGREYERRESYAEALRQYQLAMAPEVLNEESDKGMPKMGMARVYEKQYKYEEALKEMRWFPNGEGRQEHESRLQALIKSRDTGSPQPIYDHIEYLKKKYKKWLPPKGFMAGQSDIIQTTIIRLYDHIGDHEAGMKFIDEILNYALKKYDKKIRENKSAKFAYQEYQRLHLKKAEWRAYKLSYNFLLIREAFEQDKAENRATCINAKPGEVCMGRATKALIQSDYFSW